MDHSLALQRPLSAGSAGNWHWGYCILFCFPSSSLLPPSHLRDPLWNYFQELFPSSPVFSWSRYIRSFSLLLLSPGAEGSHPFLARTQFKQTHRLSRTGIIRVRSQVVIAPICLVWLPILNVPIKDTRNGENVKKDSVWLHWKEGPTQRSSGLPTFLRGPGIRFRSKQKPELQD